MIDLLLKSPVGTSVWDWVAIRNTDNFYYIPMIKDNLLTTDFFPMFLFKMGKGESWSLIGANPQISIKMGMYHYQEVYPIYVLIYIHPIQHIHEIWINHCSEISPLDHLIKMKYFHLLFYEEDTQPERSILLPNKLNISLIKDNLKDVPKWTDEQFNKAKDIAPPASKLWLL